MITQEELYKIIDELKLTFDTVIHIISKAVSDKPDKIECANRFERQKDCYHDHKTGLEWSLETHGPMPWQEAVDRCIELGSGWRLPKIEELLALVDYERCNPAAILSGMVPSYYWSFTTYASYTNYAWGVGLYGGVVYGDDKTNHNYVRCVREGDVMKYRLRENRETIIILNHEDGEFGRVHPSKRRYDLETISWPPTVVKSFASSSSAKNYAKKHQLIISEIA